MEWHHLQAASLGIQLLLTAEAELAVLLVGARLLSQPRTVGVRKGEWTLLFDSQKLEGGVSILWMLFHDLECYEQISHPCEASLRGWIARS